MFGRVSTESPADAPAPTERGWGKFLLALVAFLLVPMIPQMRAVLPVEQTMVLLVPAIAACCARWLVGRWTRVHSRSRGSRSPSLMAVQTSSTAERVL